VSSCCVQASRKRTAWRRARYAAGLLHNAGRAPAKPERGRKTTSTTARSGSSLRCAVARGPYTAASTALPPCAQRADPSARCSGPRSHCTPLRQRVPQQGAGGQRGCRGGNDERAVQRAQSPCLSKALCSARLSTYCSWSPSTCTTLLLSNSTLGTVRLRYHVQSHRCQAEAPQLIT